MPRIRRGGNRLRGSDGGRTRNEDCCCDIIADCDDFAALEATFSSFGWSMTSSDGFSNKSGFGHCNCPDYHQDLDLTWATSLWTNGPGDQPEIPGACFPDGWRFNRGRVDFTCIDNEINIFVHYYSPSIDDDGILTFAHFYVGQKVIPLPAPIEDIITSHAITANAGIATTTACVPASASSLITITPA